MNVTWTITQCDRLTADGFIITAHWTAAATDSDYTANPINNTCSWAPGIPAIPYDQVSEQDILDWCWSSGVDKAATEAALAQNIALQKAPPISQGLPWAQA